MQPDAKAPLAQVIVLAPVGVLTYRVPVAFAEELSIGMGVTVPLGRRTVAGYVTETALPGAQEQSRRLKDIVAIDNDKPLLPPSLLKLVLFASRYYRAWPGDMLRAALPHGARPPQNAYQLTESGRRQAGAEAQTLFAPAPHAITKEQVLAWAASRPKGFTATALCRALGGERQACLRLVRRLVSQHLVEPARPPQKKAKQHTWLARAPSASAEDIGPRKARAKRLFALLPEDGSAVELKALRERDTRAAGAAADLRALGLVTWRQSDVRHSPWEETLGGDASATPPVPSEDQARALSALYADIEAQRFSVSLLFGITGSGKTEVYLQAIARVLQRGLTALVLVPEIALTPQLGARFRARFGDLVATFHSGLSPAERRDEWQRVVSGEARIALGARSAIFLPLDKLGIVIVDEEHESSFKQEETPHYHARDLAIWRGKEAGAVVVLGSATPSLESFCNVSQGRSRLLSLASRAQGQALAQVDIIDLKQTPPESDRLLSPPLCDAIEQTLAREEQVILFLNRRGFAPYIVCRDCAHAFRCHQCEVSLTLHRKQHAIVCHYCGHTEVPPETCPMCLGQRVESYGPGIERLEAEVKERFASHEALRLDRDTVRSRSDLTNALERFRSGKARLLLGTQMVAKGHDFPRVTLVGVVSADASLNFPDFRAAERTFQLLTQVAGRAGRGHLKGRVLVQALDTEHEAIRAAAAQDFERFAKHELHERKALHYPPYAHLALVRIEGHELKDVESHAHLVCQRAQTEGVTLLGPAPAPLARLRGQWRFHVLVKAPTRALVQQSVAQVESMPRATQGLKRVVDIDPLQML